MPQTREAERADLKRFHSEHEVLRSRIEALLERIAAARRHCDETGRDEGRGQEAQRLVRDVAERLNAHFEDEERVGFVSHAADVAPRLSRRAESLVEEHEGFRADLAELAAEVRASGDSAQRWAEVESSARSLADALRRHEAAEAELIQEALLLDVGAGD